MKKVIGYTLAVITLLGLAIGLGVFSGFTVATLWGWFIVSTFNAPVLSIPVAMGISLLVGFFLMSIRRNLTDLTRKDVDKEDAVGVILKNLFSQYGAVSAVLGVGWIIHLFVK